MVSLKKHLPEFVVNEKYTSEILVAIQPEMNELRRSFVDLGLELSVSTCSESTLSRHEKDYSILLDLSLTIDERKKQVINKMLRKKRLTAEELKLLVRRTIDRVLNGGQFYISNQSEEYKFTVIIADEASYNSVYDALYKARPAHLIFEVLITEYRRRTGTFSCGSEPI